MKIAVDLDDTLSFVDRFTRANGYIAQKKLPFRLVNEHAQLLEQMFDWTEEDVTAFMKEGGISAFIEAPVRPLARETLAKWQREGHEILILTARTKRFFPNPEKITRDWLEKRKIPYDKIVAECESKGEYCAQNGVSVLVDNAVEYCLSAQERGVCAVLAISRGTLSRAREVRFGGVNWQQIDEKVQEIARMKELETLASHACATRKEELYDGWELHFDEWSAHRGNCVRAAQPSCLAMAEKVAACEEKYAQEGKRCRFLLTPMDGALDNFLRAQGYTVERNCAQMTLSPIPDLPSPEGVRLYLSLNERWLADAEQVLRDETLRDYSLSKGRVLYASAYCEGKPASIATAVLDGEWVGIYDVRTLPQYRRRGLARSVIFALLSSAKRLGAKRAYLQVANVNRDAAALYRSLGFIRHHEYWFRSK